MQVAQELNFHWLKDWKRWYDQDVKNLVFSDKVNTVNALENGPSRSFFETPGPISDK